MEKPPDTKVLSAQNKTKLDISKVNRQFIVEPTVHRLEKSPFLKSKSKRKSPLISKLNVKLNDVQHLFPHVEPLTKFSGSVQDFLLANLDSSDNQNITAATLGFSLHLMNPMFLTKRVID